MFACSGPRVLPAPLTASLAADFTIPGAAWGDVTGLSVAFTAAAGEQVLVCVAGTVYDSGRGAPQVTLNVDGSDIVDGVSGDGLSGVDYGRGGIGICYLTDALSAGSRTIKVRAKAPSGTPVIRTATRLSVIRF